MNPLAVFYGWDAQTMLSRHAERYRFSRFFEGFGGDFVNGLGNVAFAINSKWFPSFALAADASGYISDGTFSYAIAATELFMATVLCGTLSGLRLNLCIVAGWLITLITWPLFVFPKVISLWPFAPIFAEIFLMATIVACVAAKIGDDRWWQTGIVGLATLLGLTFFWWARRLT